MYYIVCKNIDGMYLLDKRQFLAWSGDVSKDEAFNKWNEIKKSFNKQGKLHLIHAKEASLDKQFLTVLAQY